jgi:hypothetical protein
METHTDRHSPKWSWSRLFLALGLAGAVVAAFFWGRFSSFSEATAASPPDSVSPRPTHEPAGTAFPGTADSDYSQRVVAYINRNIKITREELGEYLIARQGAERVELLVNRRIIENACKQQGIIVTEAEIEAALQDDLKNMNIISIKDFVDHLLRKFQKTLYEWKEDVVWPKLALGKLCVASGRIKITEEDVQKAFEAYHGEKVKCQMIFWPPEEKQRVLTSDIYAKIRDNPEEFNRVAKSQASPQLATQQGLLPPFGRNTTGNEEMERAAFTLQRGEVSHVIETPQGLIVLKCLDHLPPDKGVSLEKERPKLEKEIREKRIVLEIPKLFKELKEQARPEIFLTPKKTTAEDIGREVKDIPDRSSGNLALPTHDPHGN